MAKSKVREFLISNGKDFDAAIEIFTEHFSAQRRIKFKFRSNGDIFEMLDFQLSDVLGALFKLGWTCTYNNQEIDNGKKCMQSGFIHGLKPMTDREPLEYAVLGYIYSEKGWYVADGVLFGQEKTDLESVYRRILVIASSCFGTVKKSRPKKRFFWQSIRPLIKCTSSSRD